MKRKLDTSRVYKVIKLLVLLISIPSFFIGAVNFVRYNYFGFGRELLDSYDKCIDNYYELNIEMVDGAMGICGHYLNEYSNYVSSIGTSLKIGIGLPILFFGGTALFNYIAPKEKK